MNKHQDGEEEGESITLTDSSNMNVVELNIEGNSKQETREGKNLYNAYDIRDGDKTNGATIDNQDYITLQCDNTSGTSVKYTNYMTSASNVIKANTKYFGVLEIKEVSGTGTLCVTSQIGTNSQTNAYLLYDFANLSNNKKIKFNFTTIDDISVCNNFLRTFLKSDIGQSGSITFRISVFENEPNLDTFVYEAYGAMPSPSYPSEVETVNTQASVVVSNKNVFSFEKAEKLATYAMPFYEVIDNNSIELKNSADWAYIQYQYILKKDTQYTISFDLEFEGADNVTQWWTTIEDSLGSIATDFVTLVNNKYIKTFTTREDMIVKIKLFASTPINPALTIIKNIQIEEGDTATEYVPFSVQTKTVDIQQEMLEGDYFVKEKDGWKEVHVWNKRTLHDMVGWNNNYGINLFAVNILKDLNTIEKKAYCNYFKYNEAQAGINASLNNEDFAIQLSSGSIFFKDERFDNVTDWKNWLTQKNTQGNPAYVWYKIETPLKLVCTETQNKQLDDLLNTSTYKNVTHIYSTDKVSPVIKIKYRKDIETMFNQLYKNIVGGI